MLITITITVRALWRLLSVPLNTAGTYSCKNTNIYPVQTNTNLNAIANPHQTLYQPHTAPDIGPSASLPSSSSVPAVNEKISSPVITQTYTLAFVAGNKSVEKNDRLELQITPEKYLLRIDAQVILIMAKQLLNALANDQWHKTKIACIQCSLSWVASNRFLRLHEIYKNDWLAFVSVFKKPFS